MNARVIAPIQNTLCHFRCAFEHGGQVADIIPRQGNIHLALFFALAAFFFLTASQEHVELFRHTVSVAQHILHKATHIRVAHSGGNPRQILFIRR